MRGRTGSYETLQAAYDEAASGDIILMREGVFTGSLTASRPTTVTIKGGYSADYQAVTGETVVAGKLSSQNGTVAIEKVKVKWVPPPLKHGGKTIGESGKSGAMRCLSRNY